MFHGLLEMASRRRQAAASVSIQQVTWTGASPGLRAIEIKPTLFTEPSVSPFRNNRKRA